MPKDQKMELFFQKMFDAMFNHIVKQAAESIAEKKIGMLLDEIVASTEKRLDAVEKEADGKTKKFLDQISLEKEKLQTLSEEVRKKIASVKDGKDGETPAEGYLVSLIKPLIPDPIPGKDADSDKIRKELVEVLLQEVEKQVSERISKIPKSTGKFGMRKIPIVKRVNLTSQCNGATKSFKLPKDTVAVLGVFGTQFPITFDEADFTLTGNTLTLADGITAPASGQTLYVLVETLFY